MTKQEIYQQITGQCVGIENEFALGKPCDVLYARVTDARQRLAKRTGIDFEDKDMLEIIECLEKIGEICALRMFDYGAIYGKA